MDNDLYQDYSTCLARLSLQIEQADIQDATLQRLDYIIRNAAPEILKTDLSSIAKLLFPRNNWQFQYGSVPVRDDETSSLTRTPNMLDKTKVIISKTPQMAWWFLIHPNGFIRQLALEALVVPTNNLLCHFALIARLNDWVPEVRNCAIRTLKRIYDFTAPAIIADVFFYFTLRTTSWKRWSNREQDILQNYIAQTSINKALTNRVISMTTGPTSFILKCLLASSALDNSLPELAEKAKQPAVQALALKTLFEGKAQIAIGFRIEWVDKIYNKKRRVPDFIYRDITITNIDKNQLLIKHLSNSYKPIRKICARYIIKNKETLQGLPLYISIMEKDPSPSIRSLIQFLK